MYMSLYNACIKYSVTHM